jgi:hypothetical protein
MTGDDCMREWASHCPLDAVARAVMTRRMPPRSDGSPRRRSAEAGAAASAGQAGISGS